MALDFSQPHAHIIPFSHKSKSIFRHQLEILLYIHSITTEQIQTVPECNSSYVSAPRPDKLKSSLYHIVYALNFSDCFLNRLPPQKPNLPKIALSIAHDFVFSHHSCVFLFIVQLLACNSSLILLLFQSQSISDSNTRAYRWKFVCNCHIQTA